MKRLVLVALLGLSIVQAAPALAAPTQAQLQKERTETAARVYASVVGLFKAGRATTDTVYQWSVRWLDSEDSKTKLADHAKRMLELETDATKMRDAGTLGSADAEAAKYFRIEADLWVARGKR